MRRIQGIVVCGGIARRDGGHEVYIYKLSDENCPEGAQFGSPRCLRRTVRSPGRPVAGAVDYTAALALVRLPAGAEGIAALEAARPGAIFEVAGSRTTGRVGRGVGEEVDVLEGAVVTPLGGSAPREVLPALEIDISEARLLPRGVPAVVRGVAVTPVRESDGRAPLAWFLLGAAPPASGIRILPPGAPTAVRVVLFGRRAADLPAIEPGATVRAACVHRESVDPTAPWYPNEAREILFPGRPEEDLPDSVSELHGGPESSVAVT